MEFFMQRNKWYFLVGMLVLALTFSLVFISCGDDEEPDVWGSVENLDQLVGTWKGGYNETSGFADWIMDFFGDDAEDYLEGQNVGDLSVSTSVDITVVIDANYQQNTTVDITMTFSGTGIDEAWLMFSIMFGFMDDAEVNDDNHSVKMTEEEPAYTIPSVDDLGGVQINQTGTKIDMPAGLMDDAAPALILYKQ
jgi:hypothetical protein